jgi:CheY-like chemotaxis protein
MRVKRDAPAWNEACSYGPHPMTTSMVPSEPAPPPARILVVDADPANRATFAKALEPLGTVDVTGGGAEALRLLATRRFGVVLLDLELPLIDGFMILRMRAERPGPNQYTPFYAMARNADEPTRLRALQEHAVCVMAKPVPVPTMLRLVEAALQKAQRKPGR